MGSAPNIQDVANAHLNFRLLNAPTVVGIAAAASADSGALAAGIYRLTPTCDCLIRIGTEGYTTQQAIDLVNELKADYNAHRVLTTASVHGAADTTNVTAAADATTLATAYTLANELKVDYEAHRVLTAGSVHGGADSTNTISAANATTLATLITLVNELRTDFEAHRVLTAGSVHGAADATNTVTTAAITQLSTTTGHPLWERQEMIVTLAGTSYDTISVISFDGVSTGSLFISRCGNNG